MVNRRLMHLLAVGFSATATIAASGDGADQSELTFVSWGGAYQAAQTEAFLEPYRSETGIEITQDGPTDYGELVAMVEVGDVTWDVVDIEGDFGIGETERYLEPIDYSVVPGDEIIEGLADDYRVGVSLFSTVIGSNTEAFSDAPTGWADFFGPEAFPGVRSLPTRASVYVFEVALIADGVDPDDLYPLDVERAIGVLDRIKDDVVSWETGAEATEQLTSGQAELGMIWNGRIQNAIDEGAPLAIQWNEKVDPEMAPLLPTYGWEDNRAEMIAAYETWMRDLDASAVGLDPHSRTGL